MAGYAATPVGEVIGDKRDCREVGSWVVWCVDEIVHFRSRCCLLYCRICHGYSMRNSRPFDENFALVVTIYTRPEGGWEVWNGVILKTFENAEENCNVLSVDLETPRLYSASTGIHAL